MFRDVSQPLVIWVKNCNAGQRFLSFLFMSVQETATVVHTDPHWPGNGGHSRPATPQNLRAAIKNAGEFNSTSISLHKFNPKFITIK